MEVRYAEENTPNLLHVQARINNRAMARSIDRKKARNATTNWGGMGVVLRREHNQSIIHCIFGMMINSKQSILRIDDTRHKSGLSMALKT